MEKVKEVKNRVVWPDSKIITAEEFIAVFRERFNERSINISYDNNFVNVGVSFVETVIEQYKDSAIHFYEASGEVSYNFEIKLNDIEEIQMIDYFLGDDPVADAEIDLGAQFIFIGKDGSKVIIDADK